MQASFYSAILKLVFALSFVLSIATNLVSASGALGTGNMAQTQRGSTQSDQSGKQYGNNDQ